MPAQHQAGIARMKGAREWQRLLSGVAKFAPALASSTVFVDLVDTLLRDRSTARSGPPRRSANGGVSSAEGRCPYSRPRRGLSWHDFA